MTEALRLVYLFSSQSLTSLHPLCIFIYDYIQMRSSHSFSCNNLHEGCNTILEKACECIQFVSLQIDRSLFFWLCGVSIYNDDDDDNYGASLAKIKSLNGVFLAPSTKLPGGKMDVVVYMRLICHIYRDVCYCDSRGWGVPNNQSVQPAHNEKTINTKLKFTGFYCFKSSEGATSFKR